LPHLFHSCVVRVATDSALNDGNDFSISSNIWPVVPPSLSTWQLCWLCCTYHRSQFAVANSRETPGKTNSTSKNLKYYYYFEDLQREYQHMVTPSIDFRKSTVILAFSENNTWEYFVFYFVWFSVAYHVSLFPASHFIFPSRTTLHINLTRSLVLLRQVQNIQVVGFKNALLHFMSFASILFKGDCTEIKYGLRFVTSDLCVSFLHKCWPSNNTKELSS
jgi:hypothetical protein